MTSAVIKILSVDDLVDHLEIVEAFLEQNVARHLGSAIAVTSVLDGSSALEALRSEEFHLVITDLMLPYVTGSDLVWRIRGGDTEQGPTSTPRDVPIITCSLLPEGPSAANLHVRKPLSFQEFREAITGLLRASGRID